VHAACGRGSGKTELSRRYIVRWLPVRRPWPSMYFYGLPTYGQAKRVAWAPIRRLVPDSWIKKERESELYLETVFGSKLWIVGLDKPQRIEGDQWDGCVIDESCDIRPGTFARSVLPALSHKDGWCRRIGVPKRFGVGAPEFKAACDACDGVKSMYFNWPSSDILTDEQLSYAREELDERDYNEQYGASWETVAGLVFHAFDGKLNVRECAYDPTRVLIVGMDFNVDPMCWTICQRYGERELRVIDELFVRNTNTQACMELLYRRYSGHTAGIEFYGDASGKARKSSATESDYLIVRNFDKFADRRGVYFPPSNPAIKDRFAACNAMLKNAKGERCLFVDPRCKRLIADFENRGYQEGSNEPNDFGDLGHMSDAIGYVVYMLFRLRVQLEGTPRVRV
jgi:hypothetical protein